MTDLVKAYGWTAVPRKVEALLARRENVTPPTAMLANSIPIPTTALATSIQTYVCSSLNSQTYNHSMRAYYYGLAIATHSFPSWLSPSFNETYLLTCLLHDIGTTDENINATLMSFEFYGGLLVLDVLGRERAPREQSECVAEAVMRHQDLGDEGMLTRIGALIQLATILDNMGPPHLAALVHQETIEDIVRAHPRDKWSACFAKTIRKENRLKPWAHTTVLGEEDFPNGVLGNKLMEPYD